jgi:tetratricopeptide (TPR) repeat protein
MTELLGGRLSLAQHRDILGNAGMLALLVGCLENDLGEQAAAESTRRMALDLGKDAEEPGVIGWSHEMLAWFHLTAGNYRAAINAADIGIGEAPNHSVAVQLYAQQAKAYSRMGKAEEVHQALENGSNLLDKLPFPERPDNHFVVDPDKWDFYAMDTYRIVGQDDLARRNALEVIRRGVQPDGKIITPMRNSEAQLTLAVIAARQGETDEAASLGVEALQNGRQSRFTLLMVASELEHELDTYGQRAGAEFRDLFDQIKHAHTEPEPGDS